MLPSFAGFAAFYQLLQVSTRICLFLQGLPVLQVSSGQFWGFPGFACFQVLSVFTGVFEFYRVFAVFARVLLGFSGVYRFLPGFTRFYRFLQGFSACYQVLLALQGFAAFYQVLQVLTKKIARFCRVCRFGTGLFWGFPGFACFQVLSVFTGFFEFCRFFAVFLSGFY